MRPTAASITITIPAATSEPALSALRIRLSPAAKARRAWPPWARRLWRSRAALAGLIAIALAIWGEELMRGTPGQANPQAALGTNLMRVAVLLVGLVAWVRDGWRLGGRALQHPGHQAPQLRGWAAQASAARTRLGWPGTALGLLIVAALAAWCLLLLDQNFSHALAPWVWLAALVALVLTFAGLQPDKKEPGPLPPLRTSLMPHDPGEPPESPAMTRSEWLALGAILLVAAVVRLWSLDTIPFGPYTDEGDRAIDARHLNRGEPVSQSLFVFFGTGWWGVPSLYFWLVAQSLKLFGDNLAGARMIHAIAGIITVWYTYRLGRAIWSPRVGLVAAALLAVSDFAIQFSRTAGESTITLLTWTACFYYLYRALQTRRPLDFVLSGLAGGFTLYGYVAGKLLPVFMVLVALYVLARWGKVGIRRYLPGLVLLALTAGLVYAPNGLYVLQHPGTFTVRYDDVSIFSPTTAKQLQRNYKTDNWGVILAQQVGATYSAFDVGQERGPFYPTQQPILPVAWAALWVLGTAYILMRAGDVRFAVLGIWIVSGLAGAALTNDTPSLQRVAGMVPTLALVPAILLDRVARGIAERGVRNAEYRREQPGRPRIPHSAFRIPHWAMNGLIALLVVTLGAQTLYFYFGPYTAAANYYDITSAGRYAETLDPQLNMVYQMDVPDWLWWTGAALFSAKDVQGRDLVNVSDELPITSNAGKNAHFLVYPSNQQYLSILQTYYPGGQEHAVNRPDGTPLFTAYEVDLPQFDAQRQIRVRYGPPPGPLFERLEPRLGTLGPPQEPPGGPAAAVLTYPLGAEWSGGLRVPTYGTYRLNLTAPAGATLQIDGHPVLTATAGSAEPVDTRIVLAAGVHQVRLAGILADAQTPVELRWSTAAGVLVPVDRAFLWAGPQGTLLGQAYATPPSPGWLDDPRPPPFSGLPTVERRDGTLSWRSITGSLNGGTAAVWRGMLHAPVKGVYGLQATTDGQATIWIAGQIVDSAHGVPVAGMAGGGGVQLTAGDHAIEVRLQVNHTCDLYWLPPGGKQEIIPPSAFTPASGGVYSVVERPDVPSPDPRVIGATPPVLQVRQVGEIKGDWQEARGVAVLPDGRVVVGDTGHHRIVVYGADGQQQTTWGSAGTGDRHFDALTDVAASAAGLIATVDAGNDDVQLFDGSGTQQGHLTQNQLGIQPSSGLAWGPDGWIYVADTLGPQIVRISRDGQQVAPFRGDNGQHVGVDQPFDVAVTLDGTLYAVDQRQRVVRFNAAGQIDREWAVPVSAGRGGSHLALWGSYLAITNPDGNSVTLLDLASGALSSLGVTGQPLNLVLPVGVATGPDNRLYVLDSGNNRVVILEAGQ